MKSIPVARSAALVAVLWAAAQTAGAQTSTTSGAAEALHVKTLAAACAQCHGMGGKPIAGSVLPGLAGMPSDYIQAQMKAFKSGQRPATVMHQLAKGYSDAQIAQLAAYYAAQPR